MDNETKLKQLLDRKKKVGSLGALDFLIEQERKKSDLDTYITNYTPFRCTDISINKSNIDKYKIPPVHFPENLTLPPLQGLANDYSYLEKFLVSTKDEPTTKVSIIVLTYNRSTPLRKTLAAITKQSYPPHLIEVIVTDDGGNEDTMNIVREFATQLNIKYVWHKDIGFTPAAARNNGIKVANNDFIILLDVDMFPSRNLVSSYVRYKNIITQVVLVGPRKYIDINNFSHHDIIHDKDIENHFKEIITNNKVANKVKGQKSIDWRLEIFEKTNNLKSEKLPFRIFASGNVAFSKNQFMRIGGFNEKFNTWGYEDTELGFRFFNDGKYIIPVLTAVAYHQEPPNGINETDRSAGKLVSSKLFGELCPYYRKLTTKKEFYKTPKVSIYIPAYNAENTICDAIDSALKQTYRDLEVCVCDDGSTDSTLSLLERYFSNNPRVRWITQKNSGIGSASNAAVKLTKGIYVGQLDSDDYLASDVVEKCVEILDQDTNLGLVYTSYENEYQDGTIKPGYNYPIFTREKLLTAMIVHHFRMFRKLYWCRTEGFDERIKNAVDYDMYLKLAEICEAYHLNVRGYRRRLHGSNTSIVDFSTQMKNTAIVVTRSLQRQKIRYTASLVKDDDPRLTFNQATKPTE